MKHGLFNNISGGERGSRGALRCPEGWLSVTGQLDQTPLDSFIFLALSFIYQLYSHKLIMITCLNCDTDSKMLQAHSYYEVCFFKQSVELSGSYAQLTKFRTYLIYNFEYLE